MLMMVSHQRRNLVADAVVINRRMEGGRYNPVPFPPFRLPHTPTDPWKLPL